MARDWSLNLVLTVLIGLFLNLELFNVLPIFLLMLLPAHHHLLELHVTQQDTLSSWNLSSKVGNLGDCLLGELLFDELKRP